MRHSGESQVDLNLTLDWDWDVGFPLAEPRTSVDDVLPGGTCDIESVPQRQVAIHEVEVSNFSLVQISVGEREVKWHLAHYLSESPESETYIEPAEWAGGENRRYRLDPPLVVQAGEHIRACLKNDGDESLKPKVATFVSAGSRAQNAVG
jgi:hypothetical protein